MVGKFRHIETGIGLTVAQVTQLVNISSQLDYFVEAWDWLDLLDSLPSKDEKGIENLRHELVNYFAHNYFAQKCSKYLEQNTSLVHRTIRTSFKIRSGKEFHLGGRMSKWKPGLPPAKGVAS